MRACNVNDIENYFHCTGVENMSKEKNTFIGRSVGNFFFMSSFAMAHLPRLSENNIWGLCEASL